MRGYYPRGSSRGADRNRTGVNGFAGRCVATPPRRRSGYILGRAQASQSGANPGSISRRPFGSASMRARSSSLRRKSKTSKFSTRRSWLEGLGMALTWGWARRPPRAHWPALRLVEQPAQRDLARRLAVRLGDLVQRRVLGDLAARQWGVGGEHEVPLD